MGDVEHFFPVFYLTFRTTVYAFPLTDGKTGEEL